MAELGFLETSQMEDMFISSKRKKWTELPQKRAHKETDKQRRQKQAQMTKNETKD